MKKTTKRDLFLQLANPDKNGISRWVYTSEFIGKYSDLKFGWWWFLDKKGRSFGKEIYH